MELSNYAHNFLAGLSNSSRTLTAYLESEAQHIRAIILETGDTPSADDLQRVTKFLVDVELWKADCLKELTGLAIRNQGTQIWGALRGAISASDDLDALLSIMRLVGFGSSRDEGTGQRRAKRATAVLRFLDPNQWGVVDWRVAAILSLYDKNGNDMDKAVSKARRLDKRKVKADLDLIDEKAALHIVHIYRSLRSTELPRTVDVEMAFYGAAFLVWPLQDHPRL